MQSGGKVRQLGLIFLSEADAHALVEKVRSAILIIRTYTQPSAL